MEDDFFALADLEYNNHNLKKAFILFLKAANTGDGGAMDRLASMYDSGEGINYNFDKAVYWYKKSIATGNIYSMYNLGITYRNKGNYIEARLWLEKALGAGFTEAALELGKMYLICGNQKDKIIYLLNKVLEDPETLEDSREEARELLSTIENQTK